MLKYNLELFINHYKFYKLIIENNPYYKWAENYAADLYQSSVTTGIGKC